jgi:Baseplate J-like protein
MAAGTVYLDVDDEITSAASRIRSSESTKVALVVPYGSRISTSRMNFRLLSREAIVNNRRLSIIAGDPATRALAASAGLPVFATVSEYESALAGPPAGVDGGDDDGAEPIEPIMPASAAEAETTDGSPADAPPTTRRARRAAVDDDTQMIAWPAAAGAAGAVASTAGVAPVAGSAAPEAMRSAPGEAPEPSAGAARSGLLPARAAIGRWQVETPVLIGVAAVVIALLVVAVGALFILPAADITVTPRQEAIGPIPLSVTANPVASAVDTTNAVVPAISVDVPVDVSATFPTAGKRIQLTAATGTVTFRNVDFTATNTIPAGSVVSTPNGTKFSTAKDVTVPRAGLVGLQIVPAFADVNVTAVKKGTAGNVEPNTITVIPPNEDPVTLTVRNKAATTGGARDEFPKIDQKDIDKALADLHTKLDEAFTADVAAGAGAPAGTTLFPETAALGDATPTIDPATLLGQEVATFDLGLSAGGTVIAVDASPVEKIAEARLVANVGSGYRLVDGSIKVDQGKPVVTNGVVSFPVTASAARVKILDPDALRALVKGQSVDQAKTLLKPYGDVTIDTWPGWVSSITGLDARVTFTIGGQTGSGAGPGSSGASSSSSPSTSTGASSSTYPASGTSAPATSAAP